MTYKGKTVLLVEDFRVTRELEIKLLDEIGFSNIIPAENGREAVRILMQNPRIDLVISDWNMPEKDGLELLRRVRKDESLARIPFIMASAHAEKEQVKKALEHGVTGFLTKPFTARELKKAVDAAIGRTGPPAPSAKPEREKRADGKILLRTAHIQITDHLVLGVLENMIREKEITPEHFTLQTICMDGWNPVRDALADRSVDIAFILAPIAMDLFASGKKIRLISLSHKNGSVCVRKPGNSAPLHERFRNRTFFIPHLLSVHHMLSHMFLSEIGLKPGLVGQEKADVFFEVVPPIRMPAFMKENTDAAGFMAAEPIGSSAVSSGEGARLFRSGEIWENHPCCVVVVQEDLIETHPDALFEFTAGLMKAGKFIHLNPEKSAMIALDFLDRDKELGLSLPVMEEVLTDPNGIRTDDLVPSIPDLERIRDYMAQKMGIGAPLDMESFVDPRFVAGLETHAKRRPSLFRGPEPLVSRLSGNGVSPRFCVDKYESMLIFTFDSDHRLIETMISEIESFLPQADLHGLSGIVSVIRELAFNAVCHGNKNDPEKLVICTLARIRESFYKISVRDQGEGFDTAPYAPWASADSRRFHEGGLARVRDICDHMEWNPAGNLVTVYMKQEEKTRFEITEEKGRQIIRPTGKLTAVTADELRSRLRERLGAGKKSYRFDFRDVTDMDSISLSVFVIFVKNAAKKNISLDLEIVNMDEALEQLFRMTRLDRHYRISAK